MGHTTPTLDELELSNPPHARYVRELFASIDEEVRLTGAGYSRRDAFRIVVEDRVLRGIVRAGDVEHRALLELAGIPAEPAPEPTPGELLRRRVAATAGPVVGPYTGDRVIGPGRRIGRVAVREVAPDTAGVRFDDDPDAIAHVLRSELEVVRSCSRCDRPIPEAMRRDAVACSAACRQALYRRRVLEARDRFQGRRRPEGR